MAAAKKPSSPVLATNERVMNLAEDLLRLQFNHLGGFSRGGEEDVRQIVRMCKVLYSEVENPTKPKTPASRRRDEEEEDWTGL